MSGFPCPSPGNLPNPGIQPESLMSPALAGRFFTASATWEAQDLRVLFKDWCWPFTSSYDVGYRKSYITRTIWIIYRFIVFFFVWRAQRRAEDAKNLRNNERRAPQIPYSWWNSWSRRKLVQKYVRRVGLSFLTHFKSLRKGQHGDLKTLRSPYTKTICSHPSE